MSKKYFDALDNILDRPIAFNPSFKKITGSTNAALLLSQAFYWTKRTSDTEGWFYKTRDEWAAETGLTLEELDGAREKCRTTGVMEEKLKGAPATVHYRVVKPKVYELLGFQIGGFPQSGLSDLPQIGGKPESGSYPNFNKESETTSENTLNKQSLDLFTGYFGKFLSEKELIRWKTLFEAAGQERADELAAWAFRKEVHLTNRGGLLDSLETAAKNWREKPAPRGNGHKPTPPVQPQYTEEQLAAAREDARRQLLGGS